MHPDKIKSFACMIIEEWVEFILLLDMRVFREINTIKYNS